MSEVKFNEKQLQAINHIDGNMVIYAGAGSGKTSVLIQRTINMIESGIKPNDILLITFTRNSANDLKEKLSKYNIDGITIGTFHSICASILMKAGINVSKKLPEWIVENMFNKINNHHKVDMNDIMSFISYQKNYMRTYEDEFVDKESIYTEQSLREFFEAYEKEKQRQHAYDFDDYLLECMQLLEEFPGMYTWKYLMVDECQDNNSIQDKLMRLLCPYNNITIVGDERQTLYGFRGSVPELFINAPDTLENSNVVQMNVNYRSARKIVEASNEFAKIYFGHLNSFCDSEASRKDDGSIYILEHIDKETEAANVVRFIQKELKNGVPHNEIAVLYRNNDQAAHIEMLLKENGIPYEIENNASFFNKREVDIVMCVLRLLIDEDDNVAYEKLFKYRVAGFKFMKNIMLENIRKLSSDKGISFLAASQKVYCEQQWQRNELNALPLLIGQIRVKEINGSSLRNIITYIIDRLNLEDYIRQLYVSKNEAAERLESLESLKQFTRDGHTPLSFLRFAYETSQVKTKKKNGSDTVKLMTIHKSKGLEWDVVFVVGMVAGKFPSLRSSLFEESSVGYVAFTRARNKLYVFGDVDNKFFNEFSDIVCDLT